MSPKMQRHPIISTPHHQKPTRHQVSSSSNLVERLNSQHWNKLRNIVSKSSFC